MIYKISVFIILSIVLFGCSGPAPIGRESLSAVEAKYRPADKKPPLPVLKPDSPLADFITYAVLNNPEAEAVFYDWKKAVEEIMVAQSLPDPKLTFSAEIMSSVEKFLVGFMQEIPAKGKLALEAEAFSAEARKKRYLFEHQLLETIFNVKQVYYEYYLLQEKIRLVKEIVFLIKMQEKSIRANFETGFGMTEELVMVQSEQSRLSNELVNLEDSLKPLMARWRKALGVASNESQPPMPSDALIEHILPPETDLLNELLKHNLHLKALSAEVRQAQVMVERSYKEKNPDWSVGLGTDAKKDKLNWMPEVSMTLPIWRQKIAAEIASAQAGQKQAQAMLSAEEINLAVVLAEKSFAWRELQRQSRLIRENLMPLAETKLNSIDASFKTGRTGFTGWFNARRELLELKTQLAVVNAQREIVFADISLIALCQSVEETSKLFNSK
ncbi:MAG: TolC family protein [Planctomycetes bacterium]|nr:TolC family protein [Planctomycetota bacterium]